MGSDSNSNFTPRPGKDTTTGLSASLDKPNSKCQAIDVSKLRGSDLEAVNDHGRHVSIRPVNDANKSKLVEWANTRSNAASSPSTLTQKLKQAIVNNNTSNVSSTRTYRALPNGTQAGGKSLSGRGGLGTTRDPIKRGFTINDLLK